RTRLGPRAGFLLGLGFGLDALLDDLVAGQHAHGLAVFADDHTGLFGMVVDDRDVVQRAAADALDEAAGEPGVERGLDRHGQRGPGDGDAGLVAARVGGAGALHASAGFIDHGVLAFAGQGEVDRVGDAAAGDAFDGGVLTFAREDGL